MMESIKYEMMWHLDDANEEKKSSVLKFIHIFFISINQIERKKTTTHTNPLKWWTLNKCVKLIWIKLKEFVVFIVCMFEKKDDGNIEKRGEIDRDREEKRTLQQQQQQQYDSRK